MGVLANGFVGVTTLCLGVVLILVSEGVLGRERERDGLFEEEECPREEDEVPSLFAAADAEECEPVGCEKERKMGSATLMKERANAILKK